jgi:hypothetical protein
VLQCCPANAVAVAGKLHSWGLDKPRIIRVHLEYILGAVPGRSDCAHLADTYQYLAAVVIVIDGDSVATFQFYTR